MRRWPSNTLPWEVHLVNLQVLDEFDIVRRVTGLRIQDAYNRMLQNGWTLGSTQLMRILQGIIRLYHGKTVRLLERYWKEGSPDLVASLVPHFNRALCESLREAFPGRPFVTILTDFADYPPHLWIERQEQFLICGSQRAVEQARELGHANETIFQTSGMILNPRFCSCSPIDRGAERIIQFLVDSGARIDVTDQKGVTPLVLAAGSDKDGYGHPGFPGAEALLRRLRRD